MDADERDREEAAVGDLLMKLGRGFAANDARGLEKRGGHRLIVSGMYIDARDEPALVSR